MPKKQDVRPTDLRRAPRPHDAGTLILVRRKSGGRQILMGQRHKNLNFMPDKFVFPGGRVTLSDGRLVPATPLRPEVEQKLRFHTNRRNVQALALAAIRETFEEAGLLVGRKIQSASKGRYRTRSKQWSPFLAHGVVPALDRLEFVARAITPAELPRRFDARFFLTDSEQIQGNLHDTSDDSAELLDLHWFSFGEALQLDLPYVTRVVLQHVEQRYTQGNPDTRTLYMPSATDHGHVQFI